LGPKFLTFATNVVGSWDKVAQPIEIHLLTLSQLPTTFVAKVRNLGPKKGRGQKKGVVIIFKNGVKANFVAKTFN
jgi:hypothetical protein